MNNQSVFVSATEGSSRDFRFHPHYETAKERDAREAREARAKEMKDRASRPYPVKLTGRILQAAG